MKFSRFQELHEDAKVIKSTDFLDYTCRSGNAHRIGIYFDFHGFYTVDTDEPLGRLLFMSYPSPGSISMKKRNDQEPQILMVRSDDSDYAFTFVLNICNQDNTANIQMLDLPNKGKRLITVLEKSGFTRDLLKNNGSSCDKLETAPPR